MRRPWMKALQRKSSYLFPPNRRGRAHENFMKQNAFARRHGVKILTAVFNLVLAVVFLDVAYWGVLTLYVNGFFNLPQNVSHRVGK